VSYACVQVILIILIVVQMWDADRGLPNDALAYLVSEWRCDDGERASKGIGSSDSRVGSWQQQ
jgi:hypothetical protein